MDPAATTSITCVQVASVSPVWPTVTVMVSAALPMLEGARYENCPPPAEKMVPRAALAVNV